jgi:hypothetical protein
MRASICKTAAGSRSHHRHRNRRVRRGRRRGRRSRTSAKPKRRRRCPICRQPAPGYDQGDGPRRWRALDSGHDQGVAGGPSPARGLPEHGVTVAWVDWARHDAGFTRGFAEQVAWLATHTSQSAVGKLMRIALDHARADHRPRRGRARRADRPAGRAAADRDR